MRRNLLIAALAIWALAVTGALVFRSDPPPPEPPRVTDRAAPTSGRQAPHRIATLEKALLEALRAGAAEPAEVDERTRAAMSKRLVELLDTELELEGSEDRTFKREHEIYLDILRILATDAETQAVLMRRLEAAKTEDEVHNVLSYLVWSQAVQPTSEKVVKQIRASARRLLTEDENAHRRAGAAYALLRYRRPGKEEFLFGIERLATEKDPKVRRALLNALCDDTVPDLPLDRDEVRPLVEALREIIREGNTWFSGALADWSDAPGDHAWLMSLLASEPNQDGRQGLVTAFRRGSLLMTGRERESRDLLVRVMSDPGEDSRVRSVTSRILMSYAPWERETAEAYRRFVAETR